jgi:hypothetical protein
MQGECDAKHEPGVRQSRVFRRELLDMITDSWDRSDFPDVRMSGPQRRRMIMWLMLAILAALLGYFGFRGYLSPELLFHFANSLYC